MENSQLPSVFAIILNHNHLNDLIETLNSFDQQSYPNLTLVVSDNNSTDGSKEYLKSKRPDIHLIENEENLLWTGGNNIAVQYAIQKKADFVVLANNDIAIDNPKLIETLVTNFKQHRIHKVYILGVKIFDYFNKKQLELSGINMFADDNERKRRQFNPQKRKDFDFFSELEVADAVSGCFIAIDVDVFEKIGYFDDNFGIYFDEVDFCLRAWQKGYKVCINPTMKIFHKGARTAVRDSAFFLYYYYRNYFYLIKKHTFQKRDFRYYRRKYLWLILKVFMRIIIFPKKYPDKSFRSIRALYSALVDVGFKKKMGRKNGL